VKKTKKTIDLAIRKFLSSTVECCKRALKIRWNEKKGQWFDPTWELT